MKHMPAFVHPKPTQPAVSSSYKHTRKAQVQEKGSRKDMLQAAPGAAQTPGAAMVLFTHT
jgi:hypothetical protein